MRGLLVIISLCFSFFSFGQDFKPYSLKGLQVVNEFFNHQDSAADGSSGLQKIWWSEDYRFLVTQSRGSTFGVILNLWDVHNRILLKSFQTENYVDMNYYSISSRIVNIDIGKEKITVFDDENKFVLNISSGLIETVKPKKSKFDDGYGKDYVKGDKIKVNYPDIYSNFLQVNGNKKIKLPDGVAPLKYMSISEGDSILVSIHYSYQVQYQVLLIHDLLSGKLIGSYSIDDEPLIGAHFIKNNTELIVYSQKGKVSVIDFKNSIFESKNASTVLMSIPQSGHSSLIKSVEFSSDSKRLLSYDKNGTILNWDWQRGIHRNPLFFPELTGASFADDHTNDVYVHTFSSELVDFESGIVKNIIENTGFDVVSNKDCSLLVYNKQDYSDLSKSGIYVVNTETNKEERIIKELKKYTKIIPISINSKGSFVLLDCVDKDRNRYIEIVSLKTGKSIHSLPYSGLIIGAHFNSNNILVVGLYRGGIIVLDCRLKITNPIFIEPSGEIGNVIHSIVANDKQIFASGNFGRIGIWNIEDGEKVREIIHYDKPPTWFEKNKTYNSNFNVIQSIDISNNGKYLASSSHRGTIKVWSLKNLSEIQTLTSKVSKVTGVHFEGSDRYFKVSHSTGGDSFGEAELEPDSTIKRIDYHDLKISALNGHKFNVTAIKKAVSKDMFISIDNMNVLNCWGANNELLKTIYFDYSQHFEDMEVSPNGDFFVIAFKGENNNNSVQIFSTNSFEKIVDWKFTNGDFSSSKIPIEFLNEDELLIGTDKGVFSLVIPKNNARKWSKYDLKDERIQDIEILNDQVVIKLNYTVLSFEKDGTFAKEYNLLSPFDIGGNIIASNDDSNFYLFNKGALLSEIFKYDIKTNTLLKPIKHLSPTTSVDIMNNKMVVGTIGGSCFLWNILNQSLIAQFIPNKKQEMSVVTESGFYYLSDKSQMDIMAFQYGMELFSLIQFDLKYNRPDIVLEKLGYASEEKINSYRRAYQKRLQKMGFTEDMLKADFHLPELSITNKDVFESQSESDLLEFNINTTDSKYPLDRINVWINNVPLYGVNGISLRSKMTQDFDTTIQLQLNAGDNKIDISVLNQAGAESYKETTYINCTKPSPKPNLYFVGIGVKDYADESMNLKFSDKDIRDVANLYSTSNSYGEIYLDTFLNASVTQEVLPQIRKRLESSTIHDQVIFMYSGHGLLDDSLDYFLTTHDIDFLNPKDKGIPYEAIDGLIDNIRARKKLVLIDACNSGEVDKDETEEFEIEDESFEDSKGDIGYVSTDNSFEMMQNLFADLRRGTGATVISSSSGTNFSYEGVEYKNGHYTYALKLGLSGEADLNKDGEILVTELREYLYKKVVLLSKGLQKPTTRQENLEYDFRVW